ncbi:hypothetical protein ACFLTC_00580 [Chloroflexota bacterium]
MFVGTLRTIENEFDECVAGIERQSYRDLEQFVFQNLPNKEAHDILYRSLMDCRHEFDLMIKVDADIVIGDRDLFAKIVAKFQADAQLRDLEIAVYDFFSDQLIWGMHAYRNTVRWQQSDEDLLVDYVPLAEGEYICDDSELAPAAFHCKNPSPFQGFYYGVHKALKMTQQGRKKRDYHQTLSKWDINERTRQHFRRARDRRVGLAVLGAELTFRGRMQPRHLECTNPYLQSLHDYQLLLLVLPRNGASKSDVLEGGLRERCSCGRNNP